MYIVHVHCTMYTLYSTHLIEAVHHEESHAEEDDSRLMPKRGRGISEPVIKYIKLAFIQPKLRSKLFLLFEFPSKQVCKS